MANAHRSPTHASTPDGDASLAPLPWLRAMELAGWSLAGVALLAGFLTQQRLGWALASVIGAGFAAATVILNAQTFLAGLSFAGIVVLATLGVWNGIATGWSLIATSCGLLAWDLSHFRQRLSVAGHLEENSDLPKRHVLRLLTTVGVGAALGGAALIVRLRYGYWILILTAALTVGGLSVAVGYLRRESD
ncbi:MAG: hypothetical protein ACP5JG_13970 [Anaerolineae bacterium]